MCVMLPVKCLHTYAELVLLFFPKQAGRSPRAVSCSSSQSLQVCECVQGSKCRESSVEILSATRHTAPTHLHEIRTNFVCVCVFWCKV